MHSLRTDMDRLVERHGYPPMLIRLGYVQVAPPSERRPVAEVVQTPSEE